MRKTSQDAGDTSSITSGVENENKKSGTGIIKSTRNSIKRKVQTFSHEADDTVIEPLLQKEKDKTENANQSAKYLLSKTKTDSASDKGNDKDKLLSDNKVEKPSLSSVPGITEGTSLSKEKSFPTISTVHIHNHMNTNVFGGHEGKTNMEASKTQILVEIDGSRQSGYSPSPLIFTTAKIHTDGKTKHMEPVQVTPVPILSTIEGGVVKAGTIKLDEKKNGGLSEREIDGISNISSQSAKGDIKMLQKETRTTTSISIISSNSYLGKEHVIGNENKTKCDLNKTHITSYSNLENKTISQLSKETDSKETDNNKISKVSSELNKFKNNSAVLTLKSDDTKKITEICPATLGSQVAYPSTTESTKVQNTMVKQAEPLVFGKLCSTTASLKKDESNKKGIVIKSPIIQHDKPNSTCSETIKIDVNKNIQNINENLKKPRKSETEASTVAKVLPGVFNKDNVSKTASGSSVNKQLQRQKNSLREDIGVHVKADISGINKDNNINTKDSIKKLSNPSEVTKGINHKSSTQKTSVSSVVSATPCTTKSTSKITTLTDKPHYVSVTTTPKSNIPATSVTVSKTTTSENKDLSTGTSSIHIKPLTVSTMKPNVTPITTVVTTASTIKSTTTTTIANVPTTVKLQTTASNTKSSISITPSTTSANTPNKEKIVVSSITPLQSTQFSKEPVKSTNVSTPNVSSVGEIIGSTTLVMSTSATKPTTVTSIKQSTKVMDTGTTAKSSTPPKIKPTITTAASSPTTTKSSASNKQSESKTNELDKEAKGFKA